MADVFLSYSSKDYDRVTSFASFIQNECNCTVWLDKANLNAPENWMAMVVANIKSSKCVCVCVTVNSVVSEEVRKEVILADKNKKPIIFVYFEEATLPDDLQYIEAGSHVLRIQDSDILSKSISHILGNHQTANTTPKSTFPLSIEQKATIEENKPRISLGNGISTTYLNNHPIKKKTKVLTLVNTGKRGKNLRVIFRNEDLDKYSCSFALSTIESGQVLNILIHQLKDGYAESHLIDSTSLYIEDIFGTPYTISLRTIVDLTNRK